MSVNRRSASESLDSIRNRLDEESGSRGRARGGEEPCGCGGGSGAPAPGPGNESLDGSPGLDVLGHLASAFQTDLEEDANDQRRQLAESLLLTADAIAQFVAGLEERGASESAPRSRFCELLTEPLTDAVAVLRSSGLACLDAESGPPVSPEEAEAVDRAVQEVADLMLWRAPNGSQGAFPTYADAWSKLGRAYSLLLNGLTDPNAGPPAAAYRNCQVVTSAVLTVVLRGLFFNTIVAQIVPTLGCPARCPHLGCMRWCFDRYRPMRCGTWTRVPPSMFSGGGWEANCTWSIQSVQKDVCSCFRDLWDLFWGSGACVSQTRETTLRWRIGQETVWVPGRTAPIGLPGGFSVYSMC